MATIRAPESYNVEKVAGMLICKWTYRLGSFVLIFLICCTTDISAQRRKRSYSSSSLYLEPQFFLLKDENSFGQVFMGPNFSLGYNQIRQSIYGFSRYEAVLSAGAAFSGETTGLNLQFKPLDLAGGWPLIDDDDISLYLGAYVAINYYLQIYPELESGHIFWFTFIDAGPRMILDKNFKKQKIRFQFANSIVGLASRPDGLEDTYYHELHAVDIISNMHSNLQAGTFNLLNHTDLEVEWRNLSKKGSSIAYCLEYFGYYGDGRLDYLVNSISIRLILDGEAK
jgi:hypothetical protein